MSRDTTLAALVSTIEGVLGVGRVQNRPRVVLDRDDYEALLGASGKYCEISFTPYVARHGAPDGYQHEEVIVDVIVWYALQDASASRNVHAGLVADIQSALIGTSPPAFPQIADERPFQIVEPPTLVKALNLSAAWRERFQFRLLDVVST